jgi:hypothetical protein
MPRMTASSACCDNSAAEARIPRIFSLDNCLLHDRVQLLQPCCTAERLAAHIAIVRYRVVPELNRSCEGV